MRPLYPQFYILSSQSLDSLEEDVKDLPRQKVKGCYTMRTTGEKIIEDSFVVYTDADDFILELLKKHKQESALKVYPMRDASLLFSSGKEELLGFFRPLDNLRLEDFENWTYCYALKKYFVVVDN